MNGQDMAETITRDPARTPWGTLSLDEGESAEIRFGPLELRFRRMQGELWIASKREDAGILAGVKPAHASSGGEVAEAPAPGAEPSKGDGLEWTRWAAPADSVQARLAPALADRPVVVAPETPFHLTPGATARIYVRIPLWVRVSLVPEDGAPLLEVPALIMSDTWWGDFQSGELAYWLPTTARRRVTDDLFGPHVVMCPVQLFNESDEILPVEKLAVRVVHMSIFRDARGLWGSGTHVRYESHDDGSRIELRDEPPRETPDAELMTPPRQRPERGFRARTFGRFKDLAGM